MKEGSYEEAIRRTGRKKTTEKEKYYCDCAYYFYDRSDRWDFQNSRFADGGCTEYRYGKR